MSNKQKRAVTQGLSLYPPHQEIVEKAVGLLGLAGNTFSPAIQFILTDWARMRGLNSSPPQIMFPPFALPIGYTTLTDLICVLEKTQPVYAAPYIETTHGTIQGQRTDRHFIMVTQPDTLNRVHYCAMPVVDLVYINGIAFAPDYVRELAKVGEVLEAVEKRLAREGLVGRKGMVGLPKTLVLLHGALEE